MRTSPKPRSSLSRASLRPKAFLGRLPAAVALATPLLLTGCGGDGGTKKVLIVETGTSAGEFASLTDYLAHPVVQAILDELTRHRGSTPPDVAGSYRARGEVTATSVPGTFVGDPFLVFFCAGPASGGRLDVRVLDETVEDAGATSVIEGRGDEFTIYTAFRSVQTTDTGGTCEIHEVDVISGRIESDGSLSSLWIGQGVIGLVGDCGNLLVGDVQVGRTTGERTGDGCDPVPAGGSLDRVDLTVENSLVTPVIVTLDYSGFLGPQPFVVFAGEVSQPLDVPPGFTLSFESLQPSSFDVDGLEVLLGELVPGSFAQDVTPPGQSVSYVVENQVGDDIFFAPLPLNQTSESVYAVVDTAFDFGAVSPPLGFGLGVRAPLEPLPDPRIIGYYSYSIPGLIAPAETDVRFFRIADDGEVLPALVGPFPLEPSSGSVVLEVGGPAPAP